MLNLPQNPKWDIARVSHSTLVNADCFDVFPFIEDKSIDAIICDLPYGTTACKWDSILPLDKLWIEYKRILKPSGVILLTASQPFTTVLIGNDLKMFKYNLVWDKVAITNPMLAKKQPMRCHEDILVFYDKQPTYNPQMRVGVKWSRAGKKQHTTDTLGQSTLFNNGSDESEIKYPKSIVTFSNADKTKNEHPTQKPIDLMEWLIKTYTNEGDMVLDNTMGSGTTNLACLKLNRKSIGIEKEKQYYNVAVRRLSSYCG
jgi:site-specific DNA-methyltransferase (adenine-specific)